MGREFHLGDILSVTTYRLLSPRHIEGVEELVRYMGGGKEQIPHGHSLMLMANRYRKALLEQFPQFAPGELRTDLGELDEMLSGKSDGDEMKKLVEVWLAKMVAKYGEKFEVSPNQLLKL